MALRPEGGIDGVVVPDLRARATAEGAAGHAPDRSNALPHHVSLGPSGDHIEITIDGPVVKARARLELREALRPETPATVQALQSSGIEVWVASGDARSRVDAVAQACGIGTARATMTPDAKRQWLEQQQPTRTVLMVGDGVNDAPVLRQADASASLVSSAPLARHQAGVLLLNDRLDGLVAAIATARQAMRIVRQGLGLSLVYNIVGVPLAALGWLSPWMAGLGMALSSLIVVLLALRAARVPPLPAPSST